MDILTQSFLDIEKRELLNDFQYKAENQTWLNRAYGKMLVEQNLLSKEDFEVIDRGLRAVQEKLTKDDMMAASHGQDIYFVYENALYQEIGYDTACKLHVGRSRNDIYFTLFRMSLRKATSMIMQEVLDLQKQLESIAEKEMETIIPYYTYGQPSQPGTWGHYLLSIHKCLEQDLGRFHHAYETINQCPMGAAAGIGSAFPLNKYKMAEYLGFDGVIENTVVANSAVDYYLELESAMAILATTLNRVGGDLDFFSSMECGILDGDSFITGGSSIMPQKKNYEPGARLRTMTSPLYTYLTESLIAGGGVSMFPIFDTFSFFGEFWPKVDNLISCIRLLRLSLEHSRIRKDVAREKTLNGFTAATHMAEQLTMEIGEPFVKTHHIVGNMIHELLDEDNLKIREMTPERMKRASVKAVGFEVERSQEEIFAMLDPLNSLSQKVTGGTPKPEDSEKLLAEGIKVRMRNEEWLQKAVDRITDAKKLLEKRID